MKQYEWRVCAAPDKSNLVIVDSYDSTQSNTDVTIYKHNQTHRLYKETTHYMADESVWLEAHAITSF